MVLRSFDSPWMASSHSKKILLMKLATLRFQRNFNLLKLPFQTLNPLFMASHWASIAYFMNTSLYFYSWISLVIKLLLLYSAQPTIGDWLSIKLWNESTCGIIYTIFIEYIVHTRHTCRLLGSFSEQIHVSYSWTLAWKEKPIGKILIRWWYSGTSLSGVWDTTYGTTYWSSVDFIGGKHHTQYTISLAPTFF